MTDINSTFSFKYASFRGLNKRDDENELPIGETPEAYNFEIVRRTGLQKRLGHTSLFELPVGTNLHECFNYTDGLQHRTYIAVNYPNIQSINPPNGAVQNLYSSWVFNHGDPYFIETNQGLGFLVDGKNTPVQINGTTVTALTWPPTFSAANSTKLNASNLTIATNPSAASIGQPSFGEFFKNRLWLAGDVNYPYRIYASAIWDYTNFGNNSGTTINIPFFLDVPCKSPVTALKVISDTNLVVYTEREIFLLSGDYPPTTGFPAPYFNIVPLHQDDGNAPVGCLGPRLVVSRGNNDHFFVSNNGKVFQLTLTENFQQVRPLGLIDKIYPLLQNLTNDTIKRGRLVNDRTKGELLFFVPSTNSRRYPDQCFILNYADQQSEEAEWSRNRKFSNLRLRGALIDREDGNLILVSRDKLLNANSGTSYDGAAIDMVYQLSTLDLDAPDNRKEITEVDIYAKTVSGATIELYHLWEDGSSAMQLVTIPAVESSDWGDSTWGTATWTGSAGEPFKKTTVSLSNRIGKRLKMRIRHNSATEDLLIHSLVIRGRMIGK